MSNGMSKFVASLFVGLGLLLPSLSFAQTTGTGLLNVYVQVTNPVGGLVTPGSFTVTVSGQNPSPVTFPGSQSGTLVSLNPGSYSVGITSGPAGYTASYSSGCNNSLIASQTHTCVVTMSTSQVSFPYPTPYPYPYQPQALLCTPAYQTVAAGQPATFTAQGGIGGAYNWSTSDRNYPNAGPLLSVVLTSSGSQLVTVTNATQSATCSVNVTASGYYPNIPTYPTPSLTLSPLYSLTPYLPNTGFGPMGAGELALAVVLLGVASFLCAPYVRQAFSLVVR